MGCDFSVIIPAYNNKELFKGALFSALRQREAGLEVIVVDDSEAGDIQHFIRILADKRVNYYHNTSSLGAVRNWNRGLMLAKGRYIIVLHHDERFMSDYHLAQIKQQFEKGFDMIVSHIRIQKNDVIYPHHFANSIIKRLFIKHPKLLFSANAIGPCACIAAKKENMELFNEQLHWLVDVEWYYRMLKKSHAHLLDKYYYVLSYHGHQGQITTSMNITKTIKKDIKTICTIYNHDFIVKFMLTCYKLLNQFLHGNYDKK